MMHEITLNLHMHTRYSDGSGSHREIASAALECGIDAVIVTDHNVLVQNMAGYIEQAGRRVLLLIGEEIHDQALHPQKNHLLVLGASYEVAPLAQNIKDGLGLIRKDGGLSFLAHLTDPAAPAFDEDDLSWVDLSVDNFTGIELWNGLSELKSIIPTRLHGVFYAFLPSLVAHGPPLNSLRTWDELLSQRRVVAVGGSDAHAMKMHLGPLSRRIYPYEFHFRAINTHVLLDEPLTGEAGADERSIYAALAAGHCFVGYDLSRPTRGFRFSAHGQESEAGMGDEIPAQGGVTLQAYLPAFAEIRLLRNGEIVQTGQRTQALTYLAAQSGVYRVEAYRRFMGARRGWIFSNPIYLR
jgi:hypothetical protein